MLVTDETGTRSISVSAFVELAKTRLDLRVLCEEQPLTEHFLNSQRTQKLGMALSGFAESIHRGRIQIFGNSERSYLARLDEAETSAAFARLDRENISCILLTAQSETDDAIAAFAKTNEIPLLCTALPSSEATTVVSDVLALALAPVTTIHGVMMEVFGIGVLILGESGVGKSECALDLISRGHRLVSDDAVIIKRVGDDLTGQAPESIRDFLEIRGLGIINARELFGVSSIADAGSIRLCIEFCGHNESVDADRLGSDDSFVELLGLKVKRFQIPVMPGRNLAALAEAAVRVFVSRRSGPAAVEELIAKHQTAMSAGRIS